MIYLEYLLRKYHIQQQDLAKELGIKKQNINIWVTQKKPIPKKYLPVLAEKFHIPEENLQKKVEEVFAEDVCNIIEDIYFGTSKEKIEFSVAYGSNGCVRKAIQTIKDKYIYAVDNFGKQGHWDYIAWHDVYSCSLCKFDFEVPLEECPNCHAEMRIRNG